MNINDKEIRGKTLACWEANANEDYIKTPMSVLKYITILEEELQVKNNVAKSNVNSMFFCEKGYNKDTCERFLNHINGCNFCEIKSKIITT